MVKLLIGNFFNKELMLKQRLRISPDGMAPEDIINPVDERSQEVYDEYYANASPEKQKELDALDASSTVYNVSVSSEHSGGVTKPGEKQGEVDLDVQDVGEYSVGILADELTHASQIENGELGFDENGSTQAYDLQDEVDSKMAAIEALDVKGLKMQDTPAPEGAGEISAKFGKMYDANGGNLSNKQIEKWSKTKNRNGDSYHALFKATGGSTKMGVRTKPKSK